MKLESELKPGDRVRLYWENNSLYHLHTGTVVSIEEAKTYWRSVDGAVYFNNAEYWRSATDRDTFTWIKWDRPPNGYLIQGFEKEYHGTEVRQLLSQELADASHS